MVTGGPSRQRGARSQRDLLRRTLSQNYLRDPGVYLDLVDIDPGLLVVEVGAGEGTITAALADRCRAVLAYELDPRAAQAARARLAGRRNVAIVAGDFLAAAEPGEEFQVVGNLPFAKTSAILDWCLRARRITDATVITQLEYARKRTGSYGRWSMLTIQTWPWFAWTLRGRIPAARFRPVPRVDAGVLRVERRERPLIPQHAAGAYARMVELGFSGVGGSLHASLSRRYPASAVGAAFARAGLPRAALVAQASPDDWLDLFDALERGR